jgi:alkyl sulfatase BDS1-like metallo-beta-lactamase superfamily hydrolase
MALDLNVDWAGTDPAEVLAQVRNASDDEIAAALAGDERDQVLRNVFGLMARYIDSDRARGVEAAIHFKVWDRPGGGYDHYELRISDGAGIVSEAPGDDATITIKGRAADLIRVAVGDANAVKLAFRGRIRVLGDLNFARRVPDLFRLPRS